MEQKFLIVDNSYDVQTWLDNGWRIVSITAQHVAVAGSHSYTEKVLGKFAIVLERGL
jgi:hypothetical protein